jgi:hypothetical protein
LSIDCNSTTHKVFQWFALGMILVFPIGTPLMYFYQLYNNRHLIDCGQDELLNTAMVMLVSEQGDGWQVVAQERERGSEVTRGSMAEENAYGAIKSGAADMTVKELADLEESGAMAKLNMFAGTNSVSRIFYYRPEGSKSGDTGLVGLEIQLNEQGALDEALRMREENELAHPGLAQIKFLYVRHQRPAGAAEELVQHPLTRLTIPLPS